MLPPERRHDTPRGGLLLIMPIAATRAILEPHAGKVRGEDSFGYLVHT